MSPHTHPYITGQIRVGTVSDFQGQEENIVIISTVISQTRTFKRGSDNADSSFLHDPRCFNVAFSRAKGYINLPPDSPNNPNNPNDSPDSPDNPEKP